MEGQIENLPENAMNSALSESLPVIGETPEVAVFPDTASAHLPSLSIANPEAPQSLGVGNSQPPESVVTDCLLQMGTSGVPVGLYGEMLKVLVVGNQCRTK